MQTVKGRLLALVFIGVAALIAVAAVAVHGLRNGAAMLDEVGEVRLPSIVGLEIVNEGQTAVRSENRRAGLNLDRPDELKRILEGKKDIWARIDKGWKIYEPLPQTPEESVLWKQFEKDWGAWKEADAKVTKVIDALLHEAGDDGRKARKADFERDLNAAVPLFATAEQGLDKIVELNIRVADDAKAAARTTTQRTLIVMLIVAGLALAAMFGAGFVIARSILDTLGGEPDEARKVVQHIADGDLSHSIRVRDGDSSSLISRQNQMQERLRTMLKDITSAVDRTDSAAQSLAGSAQQVAAASTASSESASSMAAAVEQMSVSINQVSDNTREALTVAGKAGTHSAEGGKVIEQAVTEIDHIAKTVRETAAIMAELNNSSSQISTVVQVIRDVAEQTNLLALNAAIEAARAGESGRGFAVVADEVRKLAERTALATNEISAMVVRIQQETRNSMASMDSAVHQVDRGVELAGSAGTAIRSIRENVDQLVSVVNDIGNAIQEQSAASQQIAQRVEQVAHASEENNLAARHTADAAANLGQLASDLRGTVGRFRT